MHSGLWRRADRALYEAKSSGGGQVAHAEENGFSGGP